jgi:hypothetical protein
MRYSFTMEVMKGKNWRFGNENVIEVRNEKPNMEVLNSELGADE